VKGKAQRRDRVVGYYFLKRFLLRSQCYWSASNVTHSTCRLKDSKLSYSYSNIYPTRCNVTQFILSGNCSTCFGWYHHPSSGAQTTVSTASGICHTVTAICLYRGRVGTGLSMLWVAAIIRSANNYIYSIWYLSHRYC